MTKLNAVEYTLGWHVTLTVTLQKKRKFVEMIRKEIKIHMAVQERNQKDKILYTPGHRYKL